MEVEVELKVPELTLLVLVLLVLVLLSEVYDDTATGTGDDSADDDATPILFL